MWRWVSTKPGMTTHLMASITCAFGALMFGFTADIFLPSTSTSAFSKSPMVLVERQHAAALDQDRPAGLRRARRGLRLAARAGGEQRRCRDARGGGAKELPARQTVCSAGSTGSRN